MAVRRFTRRRSGNAVGYKRVSDEPQNDVQFLIDQGLEPHHSLLDLGCGGGRVGIPLIRYLEPGNYYGVDKEAAMISAFRQSVADLALGDRSPHIWQADFTAHDIEDAAIDFAYAYSVFTHNDRDRTAEALTAVRPALHKRSHFYATFLLGTEYSVGDEHPDRPNEWRGVWYTQRLIEEMASRCDYLAAFVGSDTANWEGVERRLLDPSISVRKSSRQWSPFMTSACLEERCAASPHTHGQHQEMFLLEPV